MFRLLGDWILSCSLDKQLELFWLAQVKWMRVALCLQTLYINQFLVWYHMVGERLMGDPRLGTVGNVDRAFYQGSRKLLSSSPKKVDFLAGQDMQGPICKAQYARVQASHPLTKSLTRTSKKLPRASKMWELLAQRTNWNELCRSCWEGLS